MFNFKTLTAGFAVILFALAIGGCADDDDDDDGGGGNGGGDPADTTAPTVTSVQPAANATDVPFNTEVTVRFSEAMSVATITDANFAVTAPGSTPVAGTVSYDTTNDIANFTPSSPLTASTEYLATVTTGVTDLAGNALAADFTWVFTTGATADTTAPTVTSTDPADMATDVPVNQALTAFFSESLDAATVTTVSFTLAEGVNSVPGTVTSPGTTAIFTPQNDLASLTTYTATLSSLIEDLAGNPLAAEYVWEFTTGSAPDTTAPTVTSTDPADTATDVPVNQAISAVFSESVNAATVDSASFTLMEGVNAVPGTVTSPGSSAIFTPMNDLAPFTTFTATLTTGIEDLAGNALAADYVWEFTTASTPDTTAPTVTSTDPADAAIDVPFNQAITAIFSEPMNTTTVTTASFTLMEGAVAVQGTVDSPGTSATFTPLSDLAPLTAYTATLTTDVEDLAGNAMAANYVWSFTTGSAAAQGPAPVVLGTAGNYAILAKSAISTTGATSIVGDLGLSPSAGSFFTGFSETMDPSNEFSTSAIVTGNLYAADYAPPTPSNLTTAVTDMETAYTDAAGRSNPDHTELGAGNIDGMTLSPGLYKWGTDVVFPNGVTLSGGADDVWIFQIAGDLTVGDGAIVTMTGGAQAKNVFWQVAGQATLGTTVDFKGIVLCQTAIVMNTGAVFIGRALAQTAVTLDANDVTTP